MNVPNFAPGCFGSSIAFDVDDVCRNCPFFEQCEKASLTVKNELRSKYGIHVPKKKQKIVVDANGDTSLVLPKKTQNLLKRLDVSVDDICGSIRNNINPFESKGPKYLSLLCHLLIRTKKPINSDQLVAAFMTKFSWKEDTAKVHARIAAQALEHVGAIRRVDGVITLKGNQENIDTGAIE